MSESKTISQHSPHTLFECLVFHSSDNPDPANNTSASAITSSWMSFCNTFMLVVLEEHTPFLSEAATLPLEAFLLS